MALSNLKQNIQEEREIIREIFVFLSYMPSANEREKEMIKKTISSLLQILNMINKTIHSLVENISPIKKLSKPESVKGLVSMVYKKEGRDRAITINESDKRRFMEER